MPIYGPTGGDFALQVGKYLNKGVAGAGQGLGQGIMNRALFREEKRKNNFEMLSKHAANVIQSQYGGDMKTWANKHETDAKELLRTMFPDDEATVDLMYTGLKEGNRTAEQWVSKAADDYMKQIAQDEQDVRAAAGAFNQISTQQGTTPSQDGLRNPGLGDLGSQGTLAGMGMSGVQAQQVVPQGNPEKAPMSGFFGGGEGLSLQEVDPDTSAPERTATYELEKAVYDMYRANQTTSVTDAGAKAKTLAFWGEMRSQPGVGGDLPRMNDILEKGQQGAYTGEPQQRRSTPSPEKAQDVISKHTADRSQYQQMRSKGKSHGETQTEVLGFNENDIHDATRQLQEKGKIENPNIKGFLEKHNIPQTFEGVGQALTYMNTTIMDYDLPSTIENFGAESPNAPLLKKYPDLIAGINEAEATPQWKVQADTQPPVAPPTQQLINNLQERSGETITLKRETSDGWLVQDEAGKGRFISKEQALNSGLIQLDPTVDATRSLFNMSTNKALAIEKYLNSPDDIPEKDKRLAQSAISTVAKQTSQEADLPQNKKIYLESGRQAAQRVTPQEIPPLVQILIEGFEGETFEQKRNNFLQAYAPKSVQEERRFTELKRQFDSRMNLDWARLELDEWIAAVNYAGTQGLTDAIDGLATAERQKAGISLLDKVVVPAYASITEQAGGDPEKEQELRLQKRKVDPAFALAEDTVMKLMSTVEGIELKQVERVIPDFTRFAAKLRARLGGETTTTVREYTSGTGAPPIEGAGFSEEEMQILNAISGGQ